MDVSASTRQGSAELAAAQQDGAGAEMVSVAPAMDGWMHSAYDHHFVPTALDRERMALGTTGLKRWVGREEGGKSPVFATAGGRCELHCECTALAA
jgi:hypothetical protein